MLFTRKLYLRVAFAIAFVTVVISACTASIFYWLTLNEQRSVNSELINQLASTVTKTAAIAAYIGDDDLAQEITRGLIENDLVSGAEISINGGITVRSGSIQDSPQLFDSALSHPFIEDEVVGYLRVLPDETFIQNQAKAIGLQNALSLMLLSLLSAFFVALFVHRRLTSPLQKLTQEFKQVDPNIVDTMGAIDIGYKKRDEIGTLIGGINSLNKALQLNLQSERDLRERTQQLEEQFRLIFEQASAGIGVISPQDTFLIVNPALEKLFPGATKDSSFAPYFVNHEHVKSTLAQMRSSQPFEQITLDLEYKVDGKQRWAHVLFAKLTEQRIKAREHQGPLIEVIVYDITSRILREREIKYEADHDSLTKLYNRRAGERALDELVTQANAFSQRFVLMMIDLDKFKPVNDTYGHDVGDAVLIEVSQRIRAVFSLPTDVCVRWGGDEFVIGFVGHDTDHSELEVVANKLLVSLSQPITVSKDICCEIGASIGIVLSPEDGETLQALIVRADETMYRVKHNGRNHFEFAS